MTFCPFFLLYYCMGYLMFWPTNVSYKRIERLTSLLKMGCENRANVKNSHRIEQWYIHRRIWHFEPEKENTIFLLICLSGIFCWCAIYAREIVHQMKKFIIFSTIVKAHIEICVDEFSLLLCYWMLLLLLLLLLKFVLFSSDLLRCCLRSVSYEFHISGKEATVWRQLTKVIWNQMASVSYEFDYVQKSCFEIDFFAHNSLGTVLPSFVILLFPHFERHNLYTRRSFRCFYSIRNLLWQSIVMYTRKSKA